MQGFKQFPMDITISERKMKMNNTNIFKRLKVLYMRYFKYLWYIFWILCFYMASNIQISATKNRTEIICLWLFAIYLFWYLYPKPKNEYLYSIPLFLYIIGYYVIHWNSICDVTKVFWHGIFG